jgi:hypothetical protein
MPMNAQKYEPINVLSLFNGFEASYVTHSIVPYRFERKDGSAYLISEIRVVNKIRSGGKDQFHYDVKTKNGVYCRLLFDTHTFTWRLVEEKLVI